jgi:hypothetical protein
MNDRAASVCVVQGRFKSSSHKTMFLLALLLVSGRLPVLVDAEQNSASREGIVRLESRHDITMSRWEGSIVAAVARPQENNAFYSFTAPNYLPEKVTIPGFDQIISLGDASNGPVALGKREEIISLLQKQDARWTHIALPPALKNEKQEWLIPATQGFGIIANRLLFHFADGKWRAPITLPSVALKKEPFRRLSSLKVPFLWRKWGEKQILVGSQLFVSWFYGPFGGIVASCDTSRKRKCWSAVGTAYTPTSMALADSGKFWIASESHAENIELALCSLDGAQWKQVAYVRLDKTDNTFAYGDTVISDLTTDTFGKVYALTGSLGHLDVWICEGEELRRLVHLDFDVDQHYKSYPSSLAVDNENDFLVTAANFDLFYFHKSSGQYKMKQLELPD